MTMKNYIVTISFAKLPRLNYSATVYALDKKDARRRFRLYNNLETLASDAGLSMTAKFSYQSVELAQN